MNNFLRSFMNYLQLPLFGPPNGTGVRDNPQQARDLKAPPHLRQTKFYPHNPKARHGYLDNRDLQQLWGKVRQEYFPYQPELDNYRVIWSTKPQKRTLASCSLEFRRIRVARELNDENYQHWLAPLLYHEMCHAALGKNVERRGRRKMWHGKSFKELEQRHPLMHSFDEWIKSGGWTKAVRRDRTLRRRHG